MRIIAIDPGYERLGIAVMEKSVGGKEILLYSECFQTSKNIAHSERLLLLGDEITRVIEQFEPTALSVETLFFSKNQKTALFVAEARGVILYTAAQKGLDIHEFMPSAIKIAVTGHGKSDKKQIMAMIGRIIKLPKPIKHDDEYDAIAAGITYFATIQSVIHKKKAM